MICEEVSCSKLHALHVGDWYLMGSSRWLCLFRKQWPVSHLMALPKSSLLSFRRWLLLTGSTLGKKIFVCLQWGEFSHCIFQVFKLCSFVMFLTWDRGIGVGRKLGLIGSGVGGRVREVPCLARTSAVSFPSFPTCALIQWRMVLCVVFVKRVLCIIYPA